MIWPRPRASPILSSISPSSGEPCGWRVLAETVNKEPYLFATASEAVDLDSRLTQSIHGRAPRPCAPGFSSALGSSRREVTEVTHRVSSRLYSYRHLIHKDPFSVLPDTPFTLSRPFILPPDAAVQDLFVLARHISPRLHHNSIRIMNTGVFRSACYGAAAISHGFKLALTRKNAVICSFSSHASRPSTYESPTANTSTKFEMSVSSHECTTSLMLTI